VADMKVWLSWNVRFRPKADIQYTHLVNEDLGRRILVQSKCGPVYQSLDFTYELDDNDTSVGDYLFFSGHHGWWNITSVQR